MKDGLKYNTTTNKIVRYVGAKNSKIGPLLKHAVKYLELPIMPSPVRIGIGTDAEIMFYTRCKIHLEKEDALMTGLASIYGLI